MKKLELLSIVLLLSGTAEVVWAIEAGRTAGRRPAKLGRKQVKELETRVADRIKDLWATAVEKKDWDTLMNLLNTIKGLALDAKDKYGRTALMVAAEEENVGVVKKLIEAGADVNAKDNFEKTVLSYAVSGGNAEIVNALIKAKANVNAKDKYKITALMVAAEQGNKALVDALIKAGADVNAKDEDGRSVSEYTTDEEIQKMLDLESAAGR